MVHIASMVFYAIGKPIIATQSFWKSFQIRILPFLFVPSSMSILEQRVLVGRPLSLRYYCDNIMNSLCYCSAPIRVGGQGTGPVWVEEVFFLTSCTRCPLYKYNGQQPTPIHPHWSNFHPVSLDIKSNNLTNTNADSKASTIDASYIRFLISNSSTFLYCNNDPV